MEQIKRELKDNLEKANTLLKNLINSEDLKSSELQACSSLLNSINNIMALQHKIDMDERKIELRQSEYNLKVSKAKHKPLLVENKGKPIFYANREDILGTMAMLEEQGMDLEDYDITQSDLDEYLAKKKKESTDKYKVN